MKKLASLLTISKIVPTSDFVLFMHSSIDLFLSDTEIIEIHQLLSPSINSQCNIGTLKQLAWRL